MTSQYDAIIKALQAISPMPRHLTNTLFGAGVFAAGLNKSPNFFFDPNNPGSSGAGTFYNPFTTIAQVNAAITGSMPGKVLGIKRGTYFKGTINLGVSGAPGAPFHIVPYGDDFGTPVFSGETARASWTTYSGDARIWQMSGFTQTVDLYDIGYAPYGTSGSRLLYVSGASLAAKITAIQNYISAPVAGTAGVFAYDSNITYAWFVDTVTEANPNLGQVISADATVVVQLTNGTVAAGGNLVVCGIGAYFARNNALAYNLNAAATSGAGVQIVGCHAGFSGAQGAGGQGLGQDAIVVYGHSQTVKLTASLFAGNYGQDAQNNALELAYTDGAVVQYNLGTNICGNSIVELWSNNTNATVLFNRGYNDVNARSKLNTGHGSGVWATNYSDGGGVNTNTAYNGGHTIAFNYVQDMANHAFDNFSRNNLYLNNTAIGFSLIPGSDFFEFEGNDATLTGCAMYNNLCVQMAPQTGTVGFMRTTGSATPVPASDYNGWFDVGRPVSGYAAVNTTTYTQLATWHTATGNDTHSHGLQVSGSGGFGYAPGDPSTLAGFSVVNSWIGTNTDYALAGAPFVQGIGMDITSYNITTDIDGNPIPSLSTPDLGCKQI
ncbi:MAG TPA: hypothetical protein VGF97_18485 [Rhizomicrobium sp.]|jgi:hypothetical protein